MGGKKIWKLVPRKRIARRNINVGSKGKYRKAFWICCEYIEVWRKAENSEGKDKKREILLVVVVRAVVVVGTAEKWYK